LAVFIAVIVLGGATLSTALLAGGIVAAGGAVLIFPWYLFRLDTKDYGRVLFVAIGAAVVQVGLERSDRGVAR
jgi:hypothetical protein